VVLSRSARRRCGRWRPLDFAVRFDTCDVLSAELGRPQPQPAPCRSSAVTKKKHEPEPGPLLAAGGYEHAHPRHGLPPPVPYCTPQLVLELPHAYSIGPVRCSQHPGHRPLRSAAIRHRSVSWGSNVSPPKVMVVPTEGASTRAHDSWGKRDLPVLCGLTAMPTDPAFPSRKGPPPPARLRGGR